MSAIALQASINQTGIFPADIFDKTASNIGTATDWLETLSTLNPMNTRLVSPVAQPKAIPAAELAEAELLTQALEYELAALEELYNRYEGKIYSYIYRKTGDQPLAEDLTAQVFLKMLEAIRGGKTWHTAFASWLYRIAHNLVVDHYRRRSRRPQISLDDAPILATESDDPVTFAELKVDIDQLRGAMRRLTEEQVQIITLRFLEGYNIRQVSQITGKSEDAVKAMQYRAVSTLRQLMTPGHRMLRK